MTIGQSTRNAGLADTQPKIPFIQRINTISVVFFCILMLMIFSGTWSIYHRSRRLLAQERQQQGIWIGRSVIANIRSSLIHRDYTRIQQILNHLDLAHEISDLVLFDSAGIQIFSHSFAQEKSSSFKSLRPLTCESPAPEISVYTSGTERFYHIGLRIISPTGPLSPDEAGEAAPRPQGTECLGTLHLGLPLQRVDNALYPVLVRVGIVTGGSFILAGVGLVLISRKIVVPLHRVSALVNRMAQGDFRLQHNPIRAKTELGMLERELSKLLSSSQSLVTTLDKVKEQFRGGAEEILMLSEEQAEFSQKQATSLYHSVQTFHDLTEAFAQMIKQATAVTEGMDAGIQTARQAENTLKETTSSLEEMRTHASVNAERMVLLGEKVAQIDHVVKIITTIADQTKLIAFNASIEAAGAGDAGGRFSVVATEVRRLANTVVESAEEMKNTVSSIQTSSSELILSSETGVRQVNQEGGLIKQLGQTVQTILSIIENISHSVQEISDALQEQQREITMISENMNHTSITSEKTLDAAKRTHEIAKELRNLTVER